MRQDCDGILSRITCSRVKGQNTAYGEFSSANPALPLALLMARIMEGFRSQAAGKASTKADRQFGPMVFRKLIESSSFRAISGPDCNRLLKDMQRVFSLFFSSGHRLRDGSVQECGDALDHIAGSPEAGRVGEEAVHFAFIERECR